MNLAAEDDAELLRRYAADKSEAAFSELVRRHLTLVYAVALRRVGGDTHLAQDVAQQVFIALAHSAAPLSRRAVLVGWLYTTTRFKAAQTVRGERRRQAREREASTMHENASSDSTSLADWEKLRPVLDEAIDELDERDREAVLLRFFEGRGFAEVGARLRLTENAARMRVERALDKLHSLLAGRGVTSTSAALGLALANQAGATVPGGLAASVTSAVLAGSATSAGGSLVTFMGIGKLQMGVAAVLAIASTAGWMTETREASALHDELAQLRRENGAVAEMRGENARLAHSAGEGEVARAQAAELARWRDEAAALRTKLAAVSDRTAAVKTEIGRKPSLPFTGQFFEASQVDRPAKTVAQIPPIFPKELRAQGANGEAMIDFVVDEQGAVRNARVLSASDPASAEAALDAVALWQYDPAQKDGRAVALHLREPIFFKMVDGKSAEGKATGSQTGAKPKMSPAPWF